MKSTPGKEPGEDLNVRKVHGAIVREKNEPTERMNRIPWWLKHLVYAPLTFWAIWYTFYMSGGFQWDNYEEGFDSKFITAEMAATPVEVRAPRASAAPRDPIAAGRTVYAQACVACHQADGAGLAGAFPPLAPSDWVEGDERRLALLVLHGLMGPILVNGEEWNGVMPGQGTTLNDRQIADVLTYIRASWGNDAPPVEEATVAELRSAHDGSPPWTAETLDALLSEP